MIGVFRSSRQKMSNANHLSGPLRKRKNKYFNVFKRSLFVICDWWISIRFVSFCVSRFVACDLIATKTRRYDPNIF